MKYISMLFKVKCNLYCGDKRIRTADICLAKAALYQLSYTPICYKFLILLVMIWAITDLNHGPHPYQGCALTN